MERDNRTFYVSIANLAIMVFGGILGYFFIAREQIDEMHQNIETLKH
ncbi:hypothetical protein [Methylophaga thalassica]